MTVVTENSIRTLPLDSCVMIDELDLTKDALEKLVESDQVQISKEELFKDLLKIVEISEQIKQAESLHQKFDIYYSQYRPLSEELKAKYSDFLTRDAFRGIETYENYMDGLKELIIAQEIMLLAFKNESNKVHQCGKLYTGMVRISELLEAYLSYFPQNLIEHIRNTASVLLSDSSLKPDHATQDESVFSYLIGLKNTAKAILWQIEKYQTGSTAYLTDSLTKNPELEREMQIQKNQAAIAWAKSRLEQIESIRKSKG